MKLPGGDRIGTSSLQSWHPGPGPIPTPVESQGMCMWDEGSMGEIGGGVKGENTDGRAVESLNKTKGEFESCCREDAPGFGKL